MAGGPRLAGLPHLEKGFSDECGGLGGVPVGWTVPSHVALLSAFSLPAAGGQLGPRDGSSGPSPPSGVGSDSSVSGDS